MGTRGPTDDGDVDDDSADNDNTMMMFFVMTMVSMLVMRSPMAMVKMKMLKTMATPWQCW